MCAAFCPDKSTDLLRGHYNWTEREAEVSQTLPCEYKGTVTEGGCDITEANATRLCNEYGRWEKPNVSRCISEVTAMLCNVRNVRDPIDIYFIQSYLDPLISLYNQKICVQENFRTDIYCFLILTLLDGSVRCRQLS